VLILGAVAGVFVALWFAPLEGAWLDNPAGAALRLAKSYAREHVLLCLVPALFIAGAIAAFISQGAVMKYLGARANKLLAYGVASVSGAVLAVCSCTVLPLFAGIYRMGAGLGPATTFLYAGPAINVLAIVLTAGVLGLRLGAARAVGAVVFSVVIGAAMHLLHRKEERAKAAAQAALPGGETPRPLWKTAALLAAMVAILVSANWARSGRVSVGLQCCPPGEVTEYVEGEIVGETAEAVTLELPGGQVRTFKRDLIGSVERLESPVYLAIYRFRFAIAAALLAGFLLMLALWVRRDELAEWGTQSWDFARQILPLLLLGVLAAGALFGQKQQPGLIPRGWVAAAVGGNSPAANLAAALAGAIMYFATLTEVPIVQGLMASGMGQGPALALLLAGPALSLPNLLVIRSVIGTQKTIVYAALVVIMATGSGLAFGLIAG
jgi:hypothetical protein